MLDRLFLLLILGREIPYLGKFFYLILKIIGVEIPISVKIKKSPEAFVIPRFREA